MSTGDGLNFSYLVQLTPAGAAGLHWKKPPEHDAVIVKGMVMKIEGGVLSFWYADGTTLNAAFAPGTWQSAEVCEAFFGHPNAISRTKKVS